MLKRSSGVAERVSPSDTQGYFAPVWIDAHHIGALSPRDSRFDVVTIDLLGRAKQKIGAIVSADCDWSPDRKHIVYAAERAGTTADPDNATTLHLLDVATGKTAQTTVYPTRTRSLPLVKNSRGPSPMSVSFVSGKARTQ